MKLMMMSLNNDIEFDMTVDRKDHVQYLTVSKSYSDNCTCSLTEQNLALNNLYYGPKILFKKMKNIRHVIN